LKQGDVPACGNGMFACGPTAAVNSFAFLQNKYPSIYDHKLIPDTNMNGMTEYAEMVAAAVALTSPTYMNCAVCNGGTLINDFISGKTKWINDKAPGTTVFKDQEKSNWPFLFSELDHMEDVELLFGFYDAAGTRIGGHYVTLTKFQWTDQNMDGIINPTETAQIGFVDPADGTIKMQSLAAGTHAQYVLTTNYAVGGTIGGTPIATTGINWAISESPIPEPATILLLAFVWFAMPGYRKPRVR
jgi:hypothetical protein